MSLASVLSAPARARQFLLNNIPKVTPRNYGDDSDDDEDDDSSSVVQAPLVTLLNAAFGQHPQGGPPAETAPADSSPPSPQSSAPALRPRRVQPLVTDRGDSPDATPPPKVDLGVRPRTYPSDSAVPLPPDYDPNRLAVRPRIADSVQHNRDVISQLETMPVEDYAGHSFVDAAGNRHGGRSRVKDALKLALVGAGVGAQGASGGGGGATIGGAAGGALRGLITGAVDKNAVARMEQQNEIAARRRQAGDDLDQDSQRAKNRLMNAQADDAAARPAEEQAKRDAQAFKEGQSRVLSTFRLLKSQGVKLDPSNPQHAQLLADAAQYGVSGVDVDAWNDGKSNLINFDRIDPDNPTQRERVSHNVATGETSSLGQSGYVAPIHANTEMTANQEHADADRDAARKDLERQRGVQNDLARVRVNQGAQRIDLTKAAQDNRFSQQTRKELGDAEKLRSESERWQSVANDADKRTRYFDPDSGEWKESKRWAEKRDEAAARAESLRAQLYGSYGYLWGGKMSRADFLANHPALSEVVRRSGSKENPIPTGEIDNYAKRYGITLTDADSTQGPGAVNPPAMPRRGAPAQARPAASAPQSGGARFTEADVRTRAQAAGKDPEAAVKAARARGLIH